MAWAAGFFDGEGCSYAVTRPNRRPQLRVHVTQKDRRPLDRFHAAIGVGRIEKKDADQWRWCADTKAAANAMKQLWLYLSEPKREQYETALAKKNIGSGAVVSGVYNDSS